MSSKTLENIPVMWQPKQLYSKNMLKFKQIIEDKYNKKIDDIWDLQQWSVDHFPEFWGELWDFSGIICSKTFEKVIDLSPPRQVSPVWFEGAKLNYAENLLKHRDDKIALVIADEGKGSEEITYARLYEESKLYAAAFRKCGLKKGEVVVCQMSNRKETLIAMIAVISIGAIWTTVLPLMGAKATLSRVQQVKPKIYLTIDGILQNGNYINMLPKIREVSEGLPSIRKVIIVASNKNSKSEDVSDIKNSCLLDDFLMLGVEEDGIVQPMLFEQVPFGHPVFILFTSGTSGVPKTIVHGSGVLLSQFKDNTLHLDCQESSVWFIQIQVGWVAWNYFTCMLFCGVTLVLFQDASSLWRRQLWNLIDRYRATHVFLPASDLDEMRKAEYVPIKENSLKSLKVILSGGSIVKPQNYDFIYEKVKKDVMFSILYGSTELMPTVFFPDVSLPVYRGECPSLSLGHKVEFLDENGKPVVDEMGEIVIANPIPNMCLGFWNDENNLKFRESYFSKYPGKFAMNDYGRINPSTKGVIFYGRSDEILKSRQHRFASSEIYNVVELFPEVIDSVCVSQRSRTIGERAVLFLKMRDGYSFNDELVGRIRDAAEREMCLTNGPDVVLETKDIPYNFNGKKLELIVKKIVNNNPYSAETVMNPESLKSFYNIPELQGY